MSELREDWHDWRYDGRGYYLVNDPEITFQDDAEAMAYCDEHNRALVGQAAIQERERIVMWLRKLSGYDATTPTFQDRRLAYQLAALEFSNAIEAGEHLK